MQLPVGKAAACGELVCEEAAPYEEPACEEANPAAGPALLAEVQV